MCTILGRQFEASAIIGIMAGEAELGENLHNAGFSMDIVEKVKDAKIDAHLDDGRGLQRDGAAPCTQNPSLSISVRS